MLAASWKVPLLEAPSPKKATATPSVFCIFWASAAPVAMVKPPPTMPLAPSMPTLKSAMCMEPPLPLQLPVLFPNSSAIMCFRSAPLAMVWPCPLWVLWI